jgi:hypothetical protein
MHSLQNPPFGSSTNCALQYVLRLYFASHQEWHSFSSCRAAFLKEVSGFAVWSKISLTQGCYSEKGVHIDVDRKILSVYGADAIAEVKLLISPFLR